MEKVKVLLSLQFYCILKRATWSMAVGRGSNKTERILNFSSLFQILWLKNLTCVWGTERKICPEDHSFAAWDFCRVMLNYGLRNWFVEQHLTLTINYFLSHLLIARCNIGVQLSVRSFVRSFRRSFVRPSVHNLCQGALLCSSDSWEYETLHSNYPWNTLPAGTLTQCPWPSFHAPLTLSKFCVESRKFTSSLEIKFISLQQW